MIAMQMLGGCKLFAFISLKIMSRCCYINARQDFTLPTIVGAYKSNWLSALNGPICYAMCKIPLLLITGIRLPTLTDGLMLTMANYHETQEGARMTTNQIARFMNTEPMK